MLRIFEFEFVKNLLLFRGIDKISVCLEGDIHYDWLSVQAIVCRRTKHAKHVKGAKVSEALPELKQSSAKLEKLIESNKDRLNVQALDITHGSMASRKAQAIYSTAVNSLNYVTEYFKHIEREDIVDKMLIRTETIGNNNPNFLEFVKLVSRESFHYLILTTTSLGASGISITCIRDEEPHTYFYSSFDDIDDERKECLLWRFFNARHEELFTVTDLKRAEDSKRLGKEYLIDNMQYIGTNESCRPYVDLLASQKLTDKSSQVLKATHMALKSREMKKVRDFQKCKYGTQSSVLGIHGKRKDLLAKELNTYLIPNELVVRGETDENDTVDEVAETINETDLFTVGEFALF